MRFLGTITVVPKMLLLKFPKPIFWTFPPCRLLFERLWAQGDIYNCERFFADIWIINRESEDFLISSILQIFSVEDIFQKYFNGMNTTYFAHKI